MDAMSEDDLTDSDRRFLIEHGGLTAAELTPEALAATNAAVERAIADAVAEVRANALTLAEVVKFLGESPAAVLQAVATGDIYSVSDEPPSADPLFPRWQFADGTLVPRIREVLATLPEDYHPLNVEHFMIHANPDYLGGRPPLSWLVEGRDLRPVLRYADDLSWI